MGYAVLWAEVADEYGCEDAVRGGMRGVGGWEDEGGGESGRWRWGGEDRNGHFVGNVLDAIDGSRDNRVHAYRERWITTRRRGRIGV